MDDSFEKSLRNPEVGVHVHTDARNPMGRRHIPPIIRQLEQATDDQIVAAFANLPMERRRRIWSKLVELEGPE